MKNFAMLWIGIVVITTCSAQSKSKNEIFNSDFKWTITVPDGFVNVEPEEWARLRGKGTAAVEKTTGGKVEDRTKTIFAFQSGPVNFFEANYQPFDEAVDGKHLESVKAVNDLLYETFKSQLPDLKIDTAFSIVKIDGREFYTTKTQLDYPNGMRMFFIMHSRLFGKKELTVNIMYVDEKKGQQMKDAWRNSKFGK